LFCHGYEERGSASVGVLAGGLVTDADVLERVAKMAKCLADHVNVYTNGDEELAEQTRAQLKSTRIDFDTRVVAALELVGEGPEMDIVLADGSRVREGFLASMPKYEQRSSLPAQLGLEMDGDSGLIKAEVPFNKTSLPGCLAAGDAATPHHGVLAALYTAAGSGGGLVAFLQNDLDDADEL
jgi:thioredoxin reductase